MTFTRGPQAQQKAHRAFLKSALIWVRYDRWIKESRRFKGIFQREIGTD